MVLLALAASLLIGSIPGTAQWIGGPDVVAQSNLLRAQILTDMSAATAMSVVMQEERAKEEAKRLKGALDLHNYYSRKMYFMNIFYVQYESRGFTASTSSGTSGGASSGGGPGPVQY